jgi:hypothetical protein
LSIRINVFRPKLTGVSHLPQSLCANVDAGDDAEISLFFMESKSNSYSDERDMTPQQQVLEFVTALLQEAGFEFYTFSDELRTAVAEDVDGEVYLLADSADAESPAVSLTF